jgi:hypothetical protein
MNASNFTLEFTVDPGSKNGSTTININLPRHILPSQLQKLGMPESEWTALYDDVHDVMQTVAKREQQKRIIDTQATAAKTGFTSVSLFGRPNKKKNDKLSNFDEQKKVHDKATGNDWDRLLYNVYTIVHPYEVTVNTIRDVHTQQMYGFEFNADPAKLRSDKVILRYDFRRLAWTLPRDDVPFELRGVPLSSWISVYDEAQEFITRQKKRKDIDVKTWYKRERGLSERSTEHAAFVTEIVEGLNIERLHEESNKKEWTLLKSLSRDAFHPYGVTVSSLRNHTRMHDNSVSPYTYAGLELRMGIVDDPRSC